MSRTGRSAIVLIYFLSMLTCFLPFYHYGYFILLVPASIYALPFAVIGWGLLRRQAWARKLALMLSVVVILTAAPLLVKKKLTILFPFPYLMSVTYPASAAAAFKTIIGTLIGGHLFILIYLLRGSVRERFNEETGKQYG